jgi:NADH-ubiquinone oxidoreductase chain 4
MLLTSLLFVPLLGVFLISSTINYEFKGEKSIYPKLIAFGTSILNFFISLVIYILFDFSNNQFQFVQEQYELSFFDLYLGIDGISIYFVLLTTLIMPLALLSN